MRLMTDEKLLALYEAVKDLELDEAFRLQLMNEMKRRGLLSMREGQDDKQSD